MNRSVPIIGLILIALVVTYTIRFPQHRNMVAVIAVIVLIISISTIITLISSAKR